MKNICGWKESCAVLSLVWVVGFCILWWCDCGIGTKHTTHTLTGKSYNTKRTTLSKLAGGVEKKLVCYYSLPSNLSPKDVDPSLCSHIVISGAQVINNSIVPFHQDILKIYSEVVSWKQQVVGLRVLLSLHHGLYTLAQNSLNVSLFAYNARTFLAKHGFDGLNVDWEGLQPSSISRIRKQPSVSRIRNSATNTYKKVHYLFLQLNNALKLASHPPMLLTALVGSSWDVIDHLYNTQQLAELVDYVSVGCYYFHTYTKQLPFTGHNSPLQSSTNESGHFGTLNLQWATRRWLQTGMPREKLVIGIPTFGQSWRLFLSKWNSVGSVAVGYGMFGGTVSYPQACTFVQEGAMYHRDDYRHAIFATRGTEWLSYEDPNTIREKVKWAVSEGVAGVMMQDLNNDDWPSVCGGHAYPLLRAARDVFHLTH